MVSKLNILVVDDKKIIGDLFDFTLGFSGHHITVVGNAKEAVGAVKDNAFDIVFLDIVMPDKDGIEVLKDIKRLAPQLPVVMMSGYAVEDKRLQAQSLGASLFLKKPFEIDDVKKIITEAVGKEI